MHLITLRHIDVSDRQRKYGMGRDASRPFHSKISENSQLNSSNTNQWLVESHISLAS